MGLASIQLLAFNGSLSTVDIVNVAFDVSPVTISPTSNSLFRLEATKVPVLVLLNFFTFPMTSLATTRKVSSSNKTPLPFAKSTVVFVLFFSACQYKCSYLIDEYIYQI